MENLSEQAVIRMLKQLGAVAPSAEATDRALEQVRQALTVPPPVTDLGATKWLSGKLVLGSLAVFLVAGGLAGWFLLPPSDNSGSDVRLSLKTPSSAIYRQRIEGDPDSAVRLLIRGDGLLRAEKSDGTYRVMDAEKHLALYVYPNKREAVLHRDAYIPKVTLYEAIRNVTSDASARRLPGKKINGKDVLGYAVTSQWQNITLWIDPQTLLPEMIECELHDDSGKSARVILDLFVFDQDLDPALFSLETPAGYNALGKDTNNVAPTDDPAFSNLTVTPLEGLGPVKFGMSRAEVEKLLGMADRAVENNDGSTVLSYGTRGISITVNEKLGATSIACSKQDTKAAVSGFGGKTDKGIALGASAANILAAYGEPDAKQNTDGKTIFSYSSLSATFTLIDNGLVELRINQRR